MWSIKRYGTTSSKKSTSASKRSLQRCLNRFALKTEFLISWPLVSQSTPQARRDLIWRTSKKWHWSPNSSWWSRSFSSPIINRKTNWELYRWTLVIPRWMIWELNLKFAMLNVFVYERSQRFSHEIVTGNLLSGYSLSRSYTMLIEQLRNFWDLMQNTRLQLSWKTTGMHHWSRNSGGCRVWQIQRSKLRSQSKLSNFENRIRLHQLANFSSRIGHSQKSQSIFRTWVVSSIWNQLWKRRTSL